MLDYDLLGCDSAKTYKLLSMFWKTYTLHPQDRQRTLIKEQSCFNPQEINENIIIIFFASSSK
jgi:hypothetical protein